MTADKRSTRRLLRDRGPLMALLGMGLLASALLVPASPATAQDEPNVSRGKYLWTLKGNCIRCHGWSGNGMGHPRSPRGPSLRDTELEMEFIIETITCGRPATEMPYHDRHAYTDDRCYGMTKDDLEDDMPKRAKKPLRPNEIRDVAAYMEMHVLGRGKITLEECEAFFEVGSTICDRYR